jgi:hypothetical protein
MARLSIWGSGRKGRDYSFVDRSISEFFGISGTAAYVHLYLGPYLGTTDTVTTNGTTVLAYDPNNPTLISGGITTIQDPILGEIRDRHYSPTTIELRVVYNINDLDFDLRQFGLFLQQDTLYIECHMGDMIAKCGRKLIPGDVLELPHRRDTGLDPANQVAANKFYIIEDASRASDGYSATWWPHIWRMKVSPMPAGQEFIDILNLPATDPLGLPIGGLGTGGGIGGTSGTGGTGGTGSSPPITVGSILSNNGVDMALNEAIDAQAKIDVPKRYFETQQFWLVLPETGDHPWIFTGDGIPPNGAKLLGSGSRFPPAPNMNDYYLRTDYAPETLFMWGGRSWLVQEKNYRTNWSAARDGLLSFINNDAITLNDDGTTAPEKTNLTRIVAPRADF